MISTKATAVKAPTSWMGHQASSLGTFLRLVLDRLRQLGDRRVDAVYYPMLPDCGCGYVADEIVQKMRKIDERTELSVPQETTGRQPGTRSGPDR
jgi:hypothetical protein